MSEPFDVEFWDESYRTGNIPWNSEQPNREIVRLVETGELKPCKVLDVGCGTGTNAIWLAMTGFSVVGVDISEKAIRIAEEKAKKADVSARFLVRDSLSLAEFGQMFDVVIDMGCYHVPDVKGDIRSRHAKSLNEVLKLSGRLLLFCFSPKEPQGYGPRRVPLAEIEEIFTPYFDIVAIRHGQWRAVDERDGPWSWFCQLKKR